MTAACAGPCTRTLCFIRSQHHPKLIISDTLRKDLACAKSFRTPAESLVVLTYYQKGLYFLISKNKPIRISLLRIGFSCFAMSLLFKKPAHRHDKKYNCSQLLKD
ncbi:hypothetical protein SPACI_035430 [Sporomusa acidovorans DSM 3132]|uniref:Uncharacterized protein n=1 Tax=Sporomusa acidovorans (strain ATCC 49682 / DSM 3132 / Mol) TaxID=1123286 RepID=A0ABZ3J4Z3_SPOA4|nr:hypothetical protein SPACI_35240 [Sporomusa acidovorans DSM 3132]SDF25898.1 hypothetical protein SAMN04488499_104023 [Sporomusa acidovorans]